MSPKSSMALIGPSGNDFAWQTVVLAGDAYETDYQIQTSEPATGAVLAKVGAVEGCDVAHYCKIAAAAQAGWASTSPEARAAVLNRAGVLLGDHSEDLAGWIMRETGSNLPKAHFEIEHSIGELSYAASLCLHPSGQLFHHNDPSRLSMASRVPLGVVGVITPWNVLFALAMRSVAPALAAGNAVVLKPDPNTPVTGGIALARLFQLAGLPAGVLACLPGNADAGEAVVADPNIHMVTFTGSSDVGRHVGKLAGQELKKVILELGGNSPMLVLEDADLAGAASCGAFGSFNHQGQVCMATSRHIVHRKIASEYTDILVSKANALPVANPADNPYALGPLINERQRARVHDIVQRSLSAGATLLAGGEYDGLFYRPTVLGNVTPDMPAFSDEIFGPVAPITIVDSQEEAIALANDTAYGLSAAVQTGSMARGLEIAHQLHAGMVHINDQTINDFPHTPMGGMGQSGNSSRFGAVSNLEEFTQWKWVTAGATPVPYPF